MAKRRVMPQEIRVTIEEQGTENEFLLVHEPGDRDFKDSQKVAVYRLVEVRTCKVTTVLE